MASNKKHTNRTNHKNNVVDYSVAQEDIESTPAAPQQLSQAAKAVKAELQKIEGFKFPGGLTVEELENVIWMADALRNGNVEFAVLQMVGQGNMLKLTVDDNTIEVHVDRAIPANLAEGYRKMAVALGFSDLRIREIFVINRDYFVLTAELNKLVEAGTKFPKWADQIQKMRLVEFLVALRKAQQTKKAEDYLQVGDIVVGDPKLVFRAWETDGVLCVDLEPSAERGPVLEGKYTGIKTGVFARFAQQQELLKRIDVRTIIVGNVAEAEAAVAA